MEHIFGTPQVPDGTKPIADGHEDLLLKETDRQGVPLRMIDAPSIDFRRKARWTLELPESGLTPESEAWVRQALKALAQLWQDEHSGRWLVEDDDHAGD